MARRTIFTLAMLLAALLARPGAAAQNGPEPVQIESSEDPIESSDADAEGPHQAPGVEPDDELDEDEHPSSEEHDALELELELATSAGTRGDGVVDALVHLSRGRWSGALGVGNGGGAQAAQRQWLRAQASVDLGVSLSAAALWQPEQAGGAQEQLQLGASGETPRARWEVALVQQSSRLSAGAAGLAARTNGTAATAMALSGATLALDVAYALWEPLGLRATAHAAGGLFSLSLSRSAAVPWAAMAPWDRLGQRGLAWPARADGALGLSLEGAPGTLLASLGAGLPAQAGSLEGELCLSGERKLGRTTLSLQLSLARIYPAELWLGSLTFGARWHFGAA